MVRLVCGCLNVKIHAQSVGLPVDQGTLELQNSSSEFFDRELREIVLNLEGVHVEHAYLLTKHQCSPWTVHRCNNCQMVTHAMHADPDTKRVLVCSDLLSDEQMIERLTVLPEYSPLFKVIVKANSESMPVVDWIPKELSETLQMIQMKLNSFLGAEEQAMEERIREFQETERNSYASLQTKSTNDKNAIVNTVLINAYKNVSESLLEAMKESPKDSPVGSVNVVSKADEEMTSFSPLSFGEFGSSRSPGEESPSRGHPVLRSESSRSRKSEKSGVRVLSKPERDPVVDNDDVFQYDPGFQDDPSQPPFSESDDEDQHDTDDSATEDLIQSSKTDGRIGEFSTSMPIGVPQWGRQISHHLEFDDDDVDAAPKDAESMAASIQALARSVHGNSSNVFGELPTSRTRARVLSSQSSVQH